MLHKARSIARSYWVNRKGSLLGVFGGQEVVMVNNEREVVADLKSCMK